MSADAADVSDLHDRVINHIYGSGLTLAGILSLERVDAEVAERLRDVINALDIAAAELRNAAFGRVLESSDDIDTDLPLYYENQHGSGLLQAGSSDGLD